MCVETATSTAALPSTRYYAMAVPSVTGFILALVVLAVAATCHQQCGERRRRRSAVKQQQQLMLTQIRIEREQAAAAAASHDSSTAVDQPNNDDDVSARRPTTPPVTSVVTPDCVTMTSSSRADADDVGNGRRGGATQNGGRTTRHWCVGGDVDAQSVEYADCSVDAVTRRAALQRCRHEPATTDHWRTSGRQPRTSTPRSLRRATTEVALWTMSTAHSSSSSSMAALARSRSGHEAADDVDQDRRADFRREHRRQPQPRSNNVTGGGRPLSTSVPLLGVSCLSDTTHAYHRSGDDATCRQTTTGNDVGEDDDRYADRKNFVYHRRPSDDRLRPITVEGVTTFPVCPSAAFLSRESTTSFRSSRGRHDDRQRRASNRSRQKNFRFSRSVQSSDDVIDDLSAPDDDDKMTTWCSVSSFRSGEFIGGGGDRDAGVFSSSHYCEPVRVGGRCENDVDLLKNWNSSLTTSRR